MPILPKETENPGQKLRISLIAKAVSYRFPLLVTEILVFENERAYPICPRCSISMEREYVAFCNRCGQKLSWILLEKAKVRHPGEKEHL